MEEAQLGTSEPSQFLMPFPPYRRSHLCSHTYHTLLHVFSHLSASPTQPHTATQDLNNHDNGSGRMVQEIQEKGSECFELFGSDFMDPKDPAPEKETQKAHETIEGVGEKGSDFSANKMALDDIELMMGTEEISTQVNGFNLEQMLMDDLELVVKGTEDLVCDGGLIPLNSGLDEKQKGGSEVELMDYKVEHVEFQHSDVNKSGNASMLQVKGLLEELNQLASETFHPSLMVNVSTSTKEQTSASVTSKSGINHERQPREIELVKSVCDATGFLPNTEVGEFEKEEQCGQEVAEAMNLSLDQDMNTEDGKLLDSAILEDKYEMPNEEAKFKKLICADNATTSSNILIEKGDIEEGEISGDSGMGGNSFDMSSADTLILQQNKVDEVQKPKNVVENMVFPCKIGSGEKEEGYETNSFMANALQNASGQVEPRTSDKNRIECGVEVAISRETIKCDKASESISVLKPGNSNDKHIGSKGVTDLPTNLAQNQVLHRGFLEENSTKDHGNSSALKQTVDVSGKKKRGPGSEEKKAKKKGKKRKNRAKMNRQLGVKRLKLHPVQKPKTITYCRHYLKGRCHEGDKCQFSHDTVPSTKSSPCCHFARHSCMKGDDCPFDHQLSKYPCNNFVSRGSCSRGDACMFSHQVPTKQDIPMPSDVCRPQLKSPLLSGHINLSMPLNNHGCSSVQQNHFTHSTGTHSHINVKHKVTNTVQKQPTTAPKGISFINVAKSSLLSPSTPKQGMVTPNKESLVQIGTHAGKSASGTTQNSVEIPKKLPSVTPKGINFLSFGNPSGKGPVCSFKSSISSLLNRENGIKMPQLVNLGLPELASSSLNKDDNSKVSDGTKPSVPQTILCSNDKNQSMAEGMELIFPGKASINNSVTDLQCSLYSHGDRSLSNSVQLGKKASDNSQTSTVTSSILPVSPFVSHQSSECLASRYHKHASNSGQRALLSTLAFAAEHESDIKLKCPAGASTV